ncbi:MAG: hypothetical protein HY562_08760 [Ignavibacteriales bacterium]|nr:hypothetical protein [Ignavibacteriales bacterium]
MKSRVHGGRQFGKPDRGSVSTIVGSFKSAVTKSCHKGGFHGFAWQIRFHDHVIRFEKDLKRIRQYN